jgi:hypothetical protein
MGRRRTGEAEAEWRARLEAWDASGLSLRAFAQREGLKAHTAWKWKRRLRGAAAVSAAFAPVVIRSSASLAPSGFELVVGGVSLRVPPGFDEASLQRLLAVLGRS